MMQNLLPMYWNSGFLMRKKIMPWNTRWNSDHELREKVFDEKLSTFNISQYNKNIIAVKLFCWKNTTGNSNSGFFFTFLQIWKHFFSCFFANNTSRQEQALKGKEVHHTCEKVKKGKLFEKVSKIMEENFDNFTV